MAKSTILWPKGQAMVEVTVVVDVGGPLIRYQTQFTEIQACGAA
jgi:hypothetical protein